MNNKKRAITDREGLASDEEEVEDLRVLNNFEEILHKTYEWKKICPREGTEGTPIHFSVNVEPITPCVTNTSERTPSFRQLNFSEIRTIGSASNQGEETGGASSGSSNQVSTPHGGNSSS